MMTTKTLLGDWEDVYSVQIVARSSHGGSAPSDLVGATYYQTHGGGPEGGYGVKDKTVWRLSRGWHQPWKFEMLPHTVLEFDAEDMMAGKVARCRLIEVYNLTETRKIVDERRLWANATEIVKCLRDALSPVSTESYKEMCLGIILTHFQILDKHLDLLPSESCATTKALLHGLSASDDSSEEEVEEE